LLYLCLALHAKTEVGLGQNNIMKHINHHRIQDKSLYLGLVSVIWAKSILINKTDQLRVTTPSTKQSTVVMKSSLTLSDV